MFAFAGIALTPAASQHTSVPPLIAGGTLVRWLTAGRAVSIVRGLMPPAPPSNPCGQPAHKRAATNRRRHTCALADRRESGIYCAGAHAARAPLLNYSCGWVTLRHRASVGYRMANAGGWAQCARIRIPLRPAANHRRPQGDADAASAL